MSGKAFLCLSSMFLVNSCAQMQPEDTSIRLIPKTNSGLDTATFAGACCWCMDAAFEHIDGVKNVISGFSGGHVENPSYELVATGTTGHLESV